MKKQFFHRKNGKKNDVTVVTSTDTRPLENGSPYDCPCYVTRTVSLHSGTKGASLIGFFPRVSCMQLLKVTALETARRLCGIDREKNLFSGIFSCNVLFGSVTYSDICSYFIAFFHNVFWWCVACVCVCVRITFRQSYVAPLSWSCSNHSTLSFDGQCSFDDKRQCSSDDECSFSVV